MSEWYNGRDLVPLPLPIRLTGRTQYLSRLRTFLDRVYGYSAFYPSPDRSFSALSLLLARHSDVYALRAVTRDAALDGYWCLVPWPKKGQVADLDATEAQWSIASR